MVLTQLIRTKSPQNHVFSFHTTMVLTQLSREEVVSNAVNRVSIPLWFLRNFGVKEVVK